MPEWQFGRFFLYWVEGLDGFFTCLFAFRDERVGLGASEWDVKRSRLRTIKQC